MIKGTKVILDDVDHLIKATYGVYINNNLISNTLSRLQVQMSINNSKNMLRINTKKTDEEIKMEYLISNDSLDSEILLKNKTISQSMVKHERDENGESDSRKSKRMKNQYYIKKEGYSIPKSIGSNVVMNKKQFIDYSIKA